MKDKKLQPISQTYNHKRILGTVKCQQTGQPRRNE